MSLQPLWRTTLAVLLACLPAVCAGAEEKAEVEALPEVSAFPVLTDGDRSAHSLYIMECADTVMPAEQTGPQTPQSQPSELSDPDSLSLSVDSAALRQFADSLQAAPTAPQAKLPRPRFVPNPQRALWLSLVLPGAGQIYNRKYWKLPIVYGGFLGCAYALMWNQMMYRDYSQAYLDIMDDDPRTNSYQEMLPPRYDITGREEQFKTIFKRKKDFYRRYRDLSAFCFVGVYLISVIDAYVDAQLSVFDISPDLSMRVEPAVIGAPRLLGSRNTSAYGVGCSLSF